VNVQDFFSFVHDLTFEQIELFLFRLTLLILFVLGLVRIVRREWRE
jgi:hypothetical protein